MSYFDQDENLNLLADYAIAFTPMVADIEAIHDLYGAPASVNGGDTVYGYQANNGTYLDVIFHEWTVEQNSRYSPPEPVVLTIYDTGGNDWLDFRTDYRDQFIDMRPFTISSVYGLDNNLWIAPSTIIENAVAGHGDDLVLGNEANNRIYGKAGWDILLGLGGHDLIAGSSGNDLLFGGTGNDRLHGGGGKDFFNFGPEDGNYRDVILDFTPHTDRIDLTAFPALTSVSQLPYVWSDQTHTSTMIVLREFGGGQIVLEGYTGTLYHDDVLVA